MQNCEQESLQVVTRKLRKEKRIIRHENYYPQTHRLKQTMQPLFNGVRGKRLTIIIEFLHVITSSK